MRTKNKEQSAKRKEQRTKNTLQTTGGQAEHGTRNTSIRRGGELGFSLVEVLVALVILAIGFLGVSLMQVMSISGNTFSKEITVATQLGQDMCEKLKTLEYSATTTDPALYTVGEATSETNPHPFSGDVNRDLDGDGNTTDLAVALGTNNIIDERGQTVGPRIYTRTWIVTNNQPYAISKRIDITVSWMEKGKTQRSVTLDTCRKVQS